MERTCRICGCTETRACMTECGACHWVETRLCSAAGCAVHARAITESDAPLIVEMGKTHREVLLASGSYEELAVQFSVPLGTIKSRISRARTELAKMRAEALV